MSAITTRSRIFGNVRFYAKSEGGAIENRNNLDELRLVSVTKRYGPVVALANLSLDVQPGEFLFILGPSGAGKTTLLRIIGGYEIPTTGSVIIAGQDVTTVSPQHRNIGMVFQNYALFPHMTVEGNVAFGLKMRGVAASQRRARVSEALDLVQMGGFDKHYPRQLSGGQQQRVALARAIVYRPNLLVLDEPLANLDRRLRETMRAELKRLQRQVGITTIMVTHDQEESLAMADRVAVIHEGHLQQIGTPAEIYRRPASRFVASFVGEMNMLDGEVIEVSGNACRVACGGICLTIPHSGFSLGNRLTICIRAEHLKLDPIQGGDIHTAGIEATVELTTYLGVSTIYSVRCKGGPQLKVLEPNVVGPSRLNTGDSVLISWSQEHVLYFGGN
jgi:spermidine/putrescine ABC transporter ATP-binding subunit